MQFLTANNNVSLHCNVSLLRATDAPQQRIIDITIDMRVTLWNYTKWSATTNRICIRRRSVPWPMPLTYDAGSVMLRLNIDCERLVAWRRWTYESMTTIAVSLKRTNTSISIVVERTQFLLYFDQILNFACRIMNSINSLYKHWCCRLYVVCLGFLLACLPMQCNILQDCIAY